MNTGASLGALDLLSVLRQSGGTFPDWDSSFADEVFKVAAASFASSPVFDLHLRALLESSDTLPDTLVDNLKQFYGYANSDNDDIALFADFLISKLTTASESQKLQYTVFGTIPRLSVYNPIIGQEEPLRIANALTFKASNGYLIVLTTQLRKIIDDFSNIVASTLPDDSSPLGVRFTIPITQFVPSLANLVLYRWIRGEVPPTWELGYMPESVLSDILWFEISMQTHCCIICFCSHTSLVMSY